MKSLIITGLIFCAGMAHANINKANWIWYPESERVLAKYPAEARYFKRVVNVPKDRVTRFAVKPKIKSAPVIDRLQAVTDKME